MVKFETTTEEAVSTSLVLSQLAEMSGKTAEEVLKAPKDFTPTSQMQPGCQFMITGVSAECIKDTCTIWGRVECTDVKTEKVYAFSVKNFVANPASLKGLVTDPSVECEHWYANTEKAKTPSTKDKVRADLQPLTEGEELFVSPTRQWVELLIYFEQELAKPDKGVLG